MTLREARESVREFGEFLDTQHPTMTTQQRQAADRVARATADKGKGKDRTRSQSNPRGKGSSSSRPAPYTAMAAQPQFPGYQRLRGEPQMPAASPPPRANDWDAPGWQDAPRITGPWWQGVTPLPQVQPPDSWDRSSWEARGWVELPERNPWDVQNSPDHWTGPPRPTERSEPSAGQREWESRNASGGDPARRWTPTLRGVQYGATDYRSEYEASASIRGGATPRVPADDHWEAAPSTAPASDHWEASEWEERGWY